MPSGASHVIPLRTWIFSRPSSSILRPISAVISSFSLTITSSVIGLTMFVRLTRPLIESARLDLDLFTAVDDALGDALRRAAVFHRDDDVLRHVGQLTGEVTRVGRLEGRIGQTLTGTVRRAEVLEHREAFAEVGLDRRLDDLAGRLGHQTTHTAELTHLFDTTASTGVSHQEDRVHVAAGAEVGFQRRHHFGRDLLAGVRPGVEHLVVTLALGDDAALVELVLAKNFLFGRRDDLAPWLRA